MLYCSRCNNSFPATVPRWRCSCGYHLLLRNQKMFSVDSLASRKYSLWRYREALGLTDSSHIVTMDEGFTPLVPATLDGIRVLLKHDYLCPTGSYKDRGTTVMMSKLKEWGIQELIEDSSGNAGASVAAYAALADIRANVYVPASASAGKIAQIAMYGAYLVATPGTREDTTRAAMEAAKHIFYASHNWSPYFVAGLKTAAYEIAEQLEWNAPDWVVTPVGGGNLLIGLYLGFRELADHKIISKIPRIAAVQAANCAPIYAAWASGMVDPPRIVKKDTAAEGIATAEPVRGREILSSIRDANGCVVKVSEDEIWTTFQSLGRQGVYVEPTAAAAPAAIADLVNSGEIKPNQSVVVLLSGSGLKATDKIMEHFNPEATQAMAQVHT